YQAKNIREHEYEAFLALDSAMAKDPDLEKDPQRKADYERARKNWAEQVNKYREKDLPELQREARKLDEEAKSLHEESHHAHERGIRFDWTELFVELGLVLCSLAVLTKRSVFWYVGILAGVVGLVFGLTVLFMGPGAAH